eukprot:TRINITY_DN14337_c3_g7_i1.p1 TRINITY_DN14337_c3_g7~~TRINITY_DN14337_c3_g7_i1.p1  ORF type:complete len:320 (-),score=57.27 TRINITY_DN14337_c3_g7_i1:237-1196(-)
MVSLRALKQRGASRSALLIVGALFAAFSSTSLRNYGFVTPLSASQGVTSSTARAGFMPVQPTVENAGSTVAWPLLGGVVALAAARLMAGARRSAPSTAIVAPAEAGPGHFAGSCSAMVQEVDEPRVVMRVSALKKGINRKEGGRRKRLGVPGRVCMLTFRKKFKGFRRLFHGRKVKRFWRPNTAWKCLWWDKEKKWVRLYVSANAQKKVDHLGLDECARRAGLDLYAWSKPHWEPNSRQPLTLKYGFTPQSYQDRKYWPDYMPYLNKGKPMADVMPGTPTLKKKPVHFSYEKYAKSRFFRNGSTPPKGLGEVELTTNRA